MNPIKRLQKGIKRHEKREERYGKILKDHEDLKYATFDKIQSGEAGEKEIKKVNRKLKRKRNRMGRIERRDLKAANRLNKKYGV